MYCVTAGNCFLLQSSLCFERLHLISPPVSFRSSTLRTMAQTSLDHVTLGQRAASETTIPDTQQICETLGTGRFSACDVRSTLMRTWAA